jgi:hypothetical protein
MQIDNSANLTQPEAQTLLEEDVTADD